MRQITEVLRLNAQGLSYRQIAQSVGISTSTVQSYLERAKRAGLSWPLPDDVDDAGLETRLFTRTEEELRPGRPEPNWLEVHREHKRGKHVTLQLLHLEYKAVHPDGLSYTQFCVHYRRWRARQDVVMRLEYAAGERMFVDFAGDTVPVTDPETGEVWNAQVFVSVLGASGYLYVEATRSQDLASWLGAHSRAVEFYGGTARAVVPDNLTYYGRWTYKYEIGAQKGAAGVLIVHETEPAGYPFSVVQGKTGEQFDLVTPDKNMGRAAVEGWITLDQAKALMQMAGQDFDALKAQAATREFTPVPLGVTASMTIHNKLRTINSKNVIAKLDGGDPAVADEYVVYSAHWDHFGKEPEGIFHGAEDDALGCASLIELGRAFTKLPAPPRRSILFLAVTAEEQGLLGSEYYTLSPIYPLAKTVADINLDSWNVHGRTKDLTLVGYGVSDLDDYARDAAGEQGRVVHADAEPEKGFYYRSDHFNFAKQGVPALDPDGGVDYIGKPAGYGQQIRDEWTSKRYHQPSDVVLPDWDLTGTREDLTVFFAVGYRVAEADKIPEWKPGNEFKAKREAMLKR